jgi:pimeloyl-ACP methyl ester carboxylesterase
MVYFEKRNQIVNMTKSIKIRSGDLDLNMSKTGTGKRNIVFIHGACSSSKVWEEVVNSHLWEGNYSLYTIDLPGHGYSDKSADPEADYTLIGLAKRLADIIHNELNKESYLLVGNSIGTNIIAEWLSLPNHCLGVFLTAASPAGGSIGLAEITLPNPNLGLVFTTSPTDEQIDPWTRDVIESDSQYLKNDLIDTFKRTDSIFRTIMGKSIGNSEWSNEIQTLRKQLFPIAIVYGENEKFVNLNYLNNSGIDFWKGKIIIIPAAGHIIPLDQPEALTRQIIEYAEFCFK